VAACQRSVSSREFSEWLAYYRLEPFGAERWEPPVEPDQVDLRARVDAAMAAWGGVRR
jgi:hypothetical protein